MKTIDKNIILLGWVSFFTDMSSAMIMPILPIFVVLILDEGMDKLGIIVAISTFASYALRLVSGYISDRYGIVKPLVVGGYAFSALSKPLIGFTHGYQSIAGLKVIERLGVFYTGVALFGALGAYIAGPIWEHLNMQIALTYALTGTLVLTLLFLWMKGRYEN